MFKYPKIAAQGYHYVMKLTLGMSALTSPCHHCSAKHKLPFLKKKQKSSLNEHGEEKFPPRNSSNL